MDDAEIWIVLVQHTSRYDDRINDYFSALEKNCQFKLVRIRTDISPGNVLERPNEAYEFSGYQDGLLAINRATKKNFLNLNKGKQNKIIFLNDTFFGAHLWLVSNLLLKILLLRKFNGVSEFVGLKFPATKNLLPLTGDGGYVSTWIFALIGDVELFEKISFYDIEEFEKFHNSESKLPGYKDYVDSINEWLRPTGFLRGWYKTYPGNTLSEEVQKRKKSSIYFEHTLGKRLSAIGFVMKDVANDKPYYMQLLIGQLRVLDRIMLNIVKIKYRTYMFFGKFISSLLKNNNVRP